MSSSEKAQFAAAASPAAAAHTDYYGGTSDVKSYARARDAFQKRDVEAARMEHAKPTIDFKEAHGETGSGTLKAIVFGGLDGIMTTFAIIAAAAAGGHDWVTVLMFAISNVIADGFAMGFGEYVGGAAEIDYARRERQREEWEVENCIDVEIAEMIELYELKGLSHADAITVVGIISRDPKLFVDFMMVDELRLTVDLDDTTAPIRQGLTMFASFVGFGMVPTLAYANREGSGIDSVFAVAVALTCVSLMALGGVKGYLTSMSIPKAALLMLLNGCISGCLSFGVSSLVETAFASHRQPQHGHR